MLVLKISGINYLILDVEVVFEFGFFRSRRGIVLKCKYLYMG